MKLLLLQAAAGGGMNNNLFWMGLIFTLITGEIVRLYGNTIYKNASKMKIRILSYIGGAIGFILSIAYIKNNLSSLENLDTFTAFVLLLLVMIGCATLLVFLARVMEDKRNIGDKE